MRVACSGLHPVGKDQVKIAVGRGPATGLPCRSEHHYRWSVHERSCPQPIQRLTLSEDLLCPQPLDPPSLLLQLVAHSKRIVWVQAFTFCSQRSDSHTRIQTETDMAMHAVSGGLLRSPAFSSRRLIPSKHTECGD
ncbi:hypothetical protein CY34DRAFT_799036 [Suillus luteus UH-Slu-Lm8-n1]|uniref:Uncharacterized protein n=1 Tax=Suillus luteus UH-Slu-Lm8-n1 TaxID=930992 RepID=A0A0D0BXV6_9AGAM|nr:hypothetical protein CY34DRAFT_799036 [Suillus luteus UH-Slu-Lm8-n1]